MISAWSTTVCIESDLVLSCEKLEFLPQKILLWIVHYFHVMLVYNLINSKHDSQRQQSAVVFQLNDHCEN